MRSAYVALSVQSDTETGRVFSALSDGGEVFMPLQEMFFATRFAPVHGELLNWPKMWRYAQVRGHVHDPQRTSPLTGERRCTRSTCLQSLSIPVRTEMPARHTPDQIASGPRSSARPNIHDDRNGIFRAGPAPWRSSRLRSSHAWGSCISFPSARISLGSHVDAGRHRFSCPFFS